MRRLKTQGGILTAGTLLCCFPWRSTWVQPMNLRGAKQPCRTTLLDIAARREARLRRAPNLLGAAAQTPPRASRRNAAPLWARAAFSNCAQSAHAAPTYRNTTSQRSTGHDMTMQVSAHVANVRGRSLRKKWPHGASVLGALILRLALGPGAEIVRTLVTESYPRRPGMRDRFLVRNPYPKSVPCFLHPSMDEVPKFFVSL